MAPLFPVSASSSLESAQLYLGFPLCPGGSRAGVMRRTKGATLAVDQGMGTRIRASEAASVAASAGALKGGACEEASLVAAFPVAFLVAAFLVAFPVAFPVASLVAAFPVASRTWERNEAGMGTVGSIIPLVAAGTWEAIAAATVAGKTVASTLIAVESTTVSELHY